MGLGKKTIGTGEEETVIVCVYGCTFSDTRLY